MPKSKVRKVKATDKQRAAAKKKVANMGVLKYKKEIKGALPKRNK